MKILAVLFAAGKLGKFPATGGTLLLSVFAYSFAFGRPYAAPCLYSADFLLCWLSKPTRHCRSN